MLWSIDYRTDAPLDAAEIDRDRVVAGVIANRNDCRVGETLGAGAHSLAAAEAKGVLRNGDEIGTGSSGLGDQP